MTKEELKREAEENSFRYTLDKPWVCEVERKQIMAHFEKGYLASAEPREKRITELEAYNAKLLQSDIDKQNKIVLLSQKVNDLQKENAERKKTVMKMNDVITKTFSKLTKAKELLKRYVKIYVNPYPEEEIELRNEAEQFLSEEELRR